MIARRINDSIVSRHAIVFQDNRKFRARCSLEEMEHTSQRTRMVESPPARGLRGGNTSENSFTMLMANLVAVYVVDFQSDLFLGAAPVSAVDRKASGNPSHLF